MTCTRQDSRFGFSGLYALGAIIGGTLMGVVAWVVAEAAGVRGGIVVACFMLVCAIGMLFPRMLPRLRITLGRQVPDAWMSWQRPNMMFLAWGTVMGLGFVTFAASAGLPIVFASALLHPAPILVGVGFGCGRAVGELSGSGVVRWLRFPWTTRGAFRSRLDPPVVAMGMLTIVATVALPGL